MDIFLKLVFSLLSIFFILLNRDISNLSWTYFFVLITFYGLWIHVSLNYFHKYSLALIFLYLVLIPNIFSTPIPDQALLIWGILCLLVFKYISNLLGNLFLILILSYFILPELGFYTNLPLLIKILLLGLMLINIYIATTKIFKPPAQYSIATGHAICTLIWSTLVCLALFTEFHPPIQFIVIPYLWLIPIWIKNTNDYINNPLLGGAYLVFNLLAFSHYLFIQLFK